MVWHIQRVGITGSGAEKIQFELLLDGNASSLIFTGSLEHPWVHVETSTLFTSDACNVQRLILLTGQFKETVLYGTVTTVLSSARQSDACVHQFPSMLTCKVEETFVAIPIPIRDTQ